MLLEQPPAPAQQSLKRPLEAKLSVCPQRWDASSSALWLGIQREASSSCYRVIDPKEVVMDTETGRSMPKKLVIRPLRREPKLPEAFYQENWSQLERVLGQIFSTRSRRLISYEEHYRRVEDLCLHHLAKPLYADLQRELDRYLEGVFRERLSDPVLASMLSARLSSSTVLEAELHTPYAPVLDLWREFCGHLRDIQSIFLYLDRTYAAESAQIPSLWEMALNLFGKHMLAQKQRVLTPTLEAVLMEIERDRTGAQPVDRDELRSVLREMFIPLGFYRSYFEPQFFKQTRAFYTTRGTAFITSGSLSDYLAYFESSIQAEAERCRAYLEPGTEKPLFAILHEVLGRHCVGTMMDRGLEGLLDDEAIEDLRRLYELLRSIDELWRLVPRYAAYIKERGLRIVNDQALDNDMIARLLALHERAERVEREAFQTDTRFHNSAQTAFEAVMNTRQPVPAELLALSFHELLRVGSRPVAERDIRRGIVRLMELFRYLSGKDSFLEYYKKYLAQRLLLDLSASMVCEQHVVELLRAECGAVYVNHIANMLKDMDLNQDLAQEYRQRPEASGTRTPSFTCKVITQAYWPRSSTATLRIPRELQSLQRSFNRFYLSRFSGRRLSWYPSLSSCEMRAQFADGEKILQVSLVQAVILMLFNERERWSFAEIREQAGIEDNNELLQVLESLSSAHCPLLIRTDASEAASGTKTLSDALERSSFRLNVSFQTSRRRLRLLDMALLERQAERVASPQAVTPDRQHQLDATIVRLLKRQKNIEHAELVQQLNRELSFRPALSDIKQRIESLIQREYIGRDEHNPNVYRYIS